MGLFGKRKEKGPSKAQQQAPAMVRGYLCKRFTNTIDGQTRILIDYVVGGLGALCGFESYMTAIHYMPIPQVGVGPEAIVFVQGANGDSYLYGERINQIIEPILEKVISGAGLSGQLDYTDIIQRTATRAGSDEYWHIVFTDGGLITDGPRALVEKLRPEIGSVLSMLSIPREALAQVYVDAFLLLLEDMKTAPPNVASNLPVYVRLFIECLYPCAHFKWTS